MKKATEIELGIAWFREDQWDLLKQTAADANAIEDTYKEWVIFAQDKFERMKRSGFNLVKVDFDVEAFNKWCKDNERITDSESRTEYVVLLLKEQQTTD